jgi:class 3 adenylate cyclase
MAAVHRYEGTVNQVMGDGIMGPVWRADRARGPCGAGLLCGPGDARSHRPLR